MKLAIIAALGQFRVIGNENKLPWHLPADLKYFKQTTMGKPIIMGRKTYESIGRPLPGRKNIVLSSNKQLQIPGVEVVHSIKDAVSSAQAVEHAEEAMVIGGADLFKTSLPQAHRLYLTYIDEEFPGDTFFPEINNDDWLEVSQDIHQPDANNAYVYRFVVLERR